MTKRLYTDEQLIEAVKTSKSHREVQRKLGFKKGHSSVIDNVYKLNLDTSHFSNSVYPGQTKYVKYIGEKRGMLTVIEVLPPERINGIRRGFRVLCKCDCGKHFITLGSYYQQGRTFSCGCNMKLAFAKYTGENSKHFKGKGKITGKYFGSIINRCSMRGYEFNLDLDYVNDLFKKQNEKCALSGLEIKFSTPWDGKTTASLDRIDSTKGYIKGNVQWVHKRINSMKSNMTDEEFIKLCGSVYTFNQNRQVK